MKNIILLVCFILTFVNYNHGYLVSEFDLEDLMKPNVRFANSLYSALVKHKKSDNFFFSPSILHAKFGFLYSWAGGNTAQQLAELIHLPNDREIVLSTFESFGKFFGNIHHENYIVFNKLYIDLGFNLENEFRTNITSGVFSPVQVERVKYGNLEENSRLFKKDINDHTYGRVPIYFLEELYSSETQMIFVTKMMVEMQLRHPFVGNTTLQFYPLKNQIIELPGMTCVGEFRTAYDEHLGANVIEMPFRDDELSLVLILPFQIDGLPKVEEKLRKRQLNKVLNPSRVTGNYLRVTVPRFSMKNSLNLRQVLEDLGVTDMFDESADFTRISTSEDGIHMDDILHQLEVKLNSTDADVIAASDESEAAENDPGSVVVDRPFLYMIQCRATGGIAFMGRYVRPSRYI